LHSLDEDKFIQLGESVLAVGGFNAICPNMSNSTLSRSSLSTEDPMPVVGPVQDETLGSSRVWLGGVPSSSSPLQIRMLPWDQQHPNALGRQKNETCDETIVFPPSTNWTTFYPNVDFQKRHLVTWVSFHDFQKWHAPECVLFD
jgi:hypothetical protein